MKDLLEIRDEIDVIDKQMVALFEARMALTQNVAEFKSKTGKPVLDKERENSKLETLQSFVQSEYNKYPVKELFTQIMSMSRKYQYSLIKSYSSDLTFEQIESLPFTEDSKVVFFGEPGSYSEQAMFEYFGEKPFQSFPSETFKEVMEMVHSGKADYGVLPIENSSTGGIQDIYDLLLHYDNYIVGEHVVKIDHSLVGLSGATIEGLKKVYSHPQGIMQCSTFFEEHPQIEPIKYLSTAAGAKKVLEDNDITQGAIASPRAASVYGLSVLKEKLNYESSNSTRFIIIANKKMYLENANKVSICFELPHESGTLYNMLSHFIYNNLNMTKIESRPILGRPWEYRFYVDFEGNLTDAGVKNAINGIKEEAVNLKVLGNFAIV